MSKQLVRSSTDKKVAGVAAGVAQHLGLDVSLVRILWILAALMGGFGVLAYIVLWIALPEGPTESATASAGGAIAVAEERYARGEIGADELATIRKNLQS